MKQTKVLPAVVAAMLLACNSQTFAADFLHSSSRFSPNGVVKEGYETGELNGVQYKFYHSDGSGTFAGLPQDQKDPTRYKQDWDIRCEKDAIADKRSCSMRMMDLWIYVYANGRSQVSIGSEHFPQSSVAIRIDEGVPLKASGDDDGDFSYAVSATIIARLKKANSVTTRYMKWPYRDWLDKSWTLSGFAEAYQYITWAVKQSGREVRKNDLKKTGDSSADSWGKLREQG